MALLLEFTLRLNPQFIKIHAAFSRVLYLSGAADYFDKAGVTWTTFH